MSQLQTFAERYVWATNLQTFVDRQRDNRAVSEAAILTKLLRFIPEPAKASEALQNMKLAGQDLSRAREPRLQPSQIYDTAYETIKPHIKLRWHSEKGMPVVFRVDETGQVKRFGDLKPERFQALCAEDKMLNEQMHYEFDEGEHSEGIRRARISFPGFVTEIYHRFRFDNEFQFSEEPALLSWSAEVPAYRVLNPSLLQPGATPNWDSFLSRVDFPETFKAFMWSLFEPTNFGRQALWIQGEGSDGKSSVFNALSAFYGREYTLTISKGSLDSQFFFGGAYGKRLALYMDCKNVRLMRTERIKSLLGADTVEINDKHDKVFSGKVYGKLFVGSNFFPQINYLDDSERTRLLLIRVARYADEFGDPEFESRLTEELPAFLIECRKSYADQCPKGRELRVPDDMKRNIKSLCTASDSELLDMFMNKELEYGPEYAASWQSLKNALKIFTVDNFGSKEDSIFGEQDLRRLLLKRGVQFSSEVGAGTQFLGVRVKGRRV